MAADIPIFAIAFDQLTGERREVAHSLIKEHANGWWHNFSDLWFVGGGSPVEWRDLLKHIVADTPTTLLVFPVKAGAGWAGSGAEAASKLQWLHKNM